MLESILLFESITSHKNFATHPVTVLFNKIDVFASKIDKTPISVTFPEYRAQNDRHTALKYFESLFRDHDRRSLSAKRTYPLEFHATSAIDTSSFKYTIEKMRPFLTGDQAALHQPISKSTISGPLSVSTTQFNFRSETLESTSPSPPGVAQRRQRSIAQTRPFSTPDTHPPHNPAAARPQSTPNPHDIGVAF